MTYKHYIVVTAMAVTLFAHHAKADERLLPYIDWITDNSELEYNGEPLPDVTVVDYALLEVLTYGDQTVAQAEYEGRDLPEVHAIYRHDENDIVFPDTVSPWEEEEVIVHELVHFLQYMNREPPECVQSWEKQAYDLHWQWVEETGYDAEEPNWLFVFMLEMSCQDMHPNIAP